MENKSSARLANEINYNCITMQRTNLKNLNVIYRSNGFLSFRFNNVIQLTVAIQVKVLAIHSLAIRFFLYTLVTDSTMVAFVLNTNTWLRLLRLSETNSERPFSNASHLSKRVQGQGFLPLSHVFMNSI